MVKELEVAIERLQALYNQYFMGIEKLEPTIPKKTVERKLNELRKIKFYNTALRFRFQSQVQKYSTHMTYWRRICRQIEEGTYKRDIMRAKARAEQVQPAEQISVEEKRDPQTEDTTPDGFPVFDLEEMFNEVEDAFEQGFSLDAQLDAISEAAAPPPSPPQRDMVEPVGRTLAADAPSSSRPSGIPIPVSSLKASRKTDEARVKTDPSQGLQSRFRSASIGTSGSRAVDASQSPPLNHPPRATAAAPPPPPRKPAAPPVKPPPIPSPKGGSSSIDDRKIQSVYRAYVSARKQTNEGTDNINLQKISTLLKKTEKAKGGVSDFKVVIRNGKAVIKAVK